MEQIRTHTVLKRREQLTNTLSYKTPICKWSIDKWPFRIYTKNTKYIILVHKELFKRNLKVQSLLGELRGEYHENLEIWKIIDTTLIVACSFLWFRFQSSTMVVVFCLLKSISIGMFFLPFYLLGIWIRQVTCRLLQWIKYKKFNSVLTKKVKSLLHFGLH